jgi:hypothetical protein
MRYSLVLPRGEPSDSVEVRKALDSARDFSEKGDARNALQWLRRAAWASANSGHETRAAAISKAAKIIQTQLETQPYDPSNISDDALSVPVSGAQPTSRRIEGPTARPAPRASAKPPRPGVPKESSRSSERVAARESKRVSQRPTTKKRLTPPEETSRVVTTPPSQEPPTAVEGVESSMDLVVTVAAGEWEGTEAAHLVGHRAMRVAVARSAKDGSFIVTPLNAGQVAPKDATVALLVSFEPAVSNLTRAG